MRASTSASQACGSTSFILAVTIRLYMTAARWPPRSEPQNNHDLRLCRGLHKRNYAQHVIMRSSSRGAPRFPWLGWAKAGAHTVLLCT